MKLAHECWGSGEPALLRLHGFTGSRASWDHLRPFLGEHFRAVAVDLPGHGDSAPAGTFEETIDALELILEQLGIRSAHVLGYSQGARLALGFALRHRPRVARLILESGSPGLRRRRQRVARRLDDGRLAEQIEAGGVDAFAARWEALPLFASQADLPPALAEGLSARRRASSASGLAHALRALGLGSQPNFWPLLPSLRVPTLLISGSRDAKFTRIARCMAAELPLAWACELDGGHSPHLEAPEAYARELISFTQAQWSEAQFAPAEP
jgi:2-succinyl-6-hydroxy-2,4-cyclohexadiene-1-carboxylate synthase